MFISLAEFQGSKRFELRFVDLADYSVVFGAQLDLVNENPLQAVRFFTRLPALPIVKPGAYVLELLCDDETLGGYRIEAEFLPAVPS